MRLDANDILLKTLPDDASDSEVSRLKNYLAFLQKQGTPWYLPNLVAYDAHLAALGRSPRSRLAYLSTVRGCYRVLADDVQLPDTLKQVPGDHEEARARIRNAAFAESPAAVAASEQTVTYPSQPQLERIFDVPFLESPQQIRDLLIVGLAFSAGLSEAELCALDVKHVRESSNSEKLLVPTETGTREVGLYDAVLFDAGWIHEAVAQLLKAIDRDEGAIFAGFFRGGKKVRSERLKVISLQKAVRQHMARQQVVREDTEDNEKAKSITVLDLRRAYARRLYIMGKADLPTLHQNLGHSLMATTREYVGPPQREDDETPPEVIKSLSAQHLIKALKYWEWKR